MTNLTETTPAQIQMAVWQIALRRVEPRRATSGGPRDRTTHLAYQRAYEARRRTFGVRTAEGIAYYTDRVKANRVRRGLRQLSTWGVVPTFYHADCVAAGVAVASILAKRAA